MSESPLSWRNSQWTNTEIKSISMNNVRRRHIKFLLIYELLSAHINMMWRETIDEEQQQQKLLKPDAIISSAYKAWSFIAWHVCGGMLAKGFYEVFSFHSFMLLKGGVGDWVVESNNVEVHKLFSVKLNI